MHPCIHTYIHTHLYTYICIYTHTYVILPFGQMCIYIINLKAVMYLTTVFCTRNVRFILTRFGQILNTTLNIN